MKRYEVMLIKAPDCKRGWLAYVDQKLVPLTRADLIVVVYAENAAKAKNKAITDINKYGVPDDCKIRERLP